MCEEYICFYVYMCVYLCICVYARPKKTVKGKNTWKGKTAFLLHTYTITTRECNCVLVCVFILFVCAFVCNEKWKFFRFSATRKGKVLCSVFSSSVFFQYNIFCLSLNFFHRNKTFSLFWVEKMLCISVCEWGFSFSFYGLGCILFKGFEGGKVHFFNFTKIHNAVRVFHWCLYVVVIVFVCWKNYIIYPLNSSTLNHLKINYPRHPPFSIILNFQHRKTGKFLCAGFRKYLFPAQQQMKISHPCPHPPPHTLSFLYQYVTHTPFSSSTRMSFNLN